MTKQLSVAILGAELTPLAKVGGLGDVMGALPKTLYTLGVDVATFIPFYGLIGRDGLGLRLVAKDLTVETGGGFKLSVWQTRLPGSESKLFLLEHPYFSGKEIYSQEQLIGSDLKITEAQKFIVFSQAALVAMKAIGFKPQIIHLNDWHTAPLLSFLEEEKRMSSSFFSKTKTVYTIHNLANQGRFLLADLQLPVNELAVKSCLSSDYVNFMAMGILGSDIVNTVSKTYAKEILTHEQGAGLEEILSQRRNDLFGVVNGIDTAFFNPKTDAFLKQNYDVGSLDKKAANKLELQKELALPQDLNIPVFGLVSRLVNQKGLDLLDDRIGKLNAQFIFLGTGQKDVEERISGWAQKFPDKIKAIIGFDAGLAQRIYAGSDIFLMPSRFEPCGLGQLIAMRYGTLPLVRKTGGLTDTVTSRKGFLFKEYDSNALLKTIKKAIGLYQADPIAWRKRQASVMSEDYSWQKPAKTYIKLYKKC